MLFWLRQRQKFTRRRLQSVQIDRGLRIDVEVSRQGSLMTISSRPVPLALRLFAALEDDAIRRCHPVVAAASGPRVNFAATIANENDSAVDDLR